MLYAINHQLSLLTHYDTAPTMSEIQTLFEEVDMVIKSASVYRVSYILSDIEYRVRQSLTQVIFAYSLLLVMLHLVLRLSLPNHAS